MSYVKVKPFKDYALVFCDICNENLNELWGAFLDVYHKREFMMDGHMKAKVLAVDLYPDGLSKANDVARLHYQWHVDGRKSITRLPLQGEHQ